MIHFQKEFHDLGLMFPIASFVQKFQTSLLKLIQGTLTKGEGAVQLTSLY